MARSRLPGRLLEAVGNGGPRGMAAALFAWKVRENRTGLRKRVTELGLQGRSRF